MGQTIQKRMSALTALDNAQVDKLITSHTEAQKWVMAVDCVIPDSGSAQLDEGTRHIPGDRIGLLTQSRLVPESMLPNRMDTILDGTMVRSGSGQSTKWTFTVTATGKKYVCPKPTASGEERPDIGSIYRDVTLDGGGDTTPIYTQYRYVPDEATAGTENETGSFVPIPSDLVMVNGQGTEVSDSLVDYTRQVNVLVGAPAAETTTPIKSIFISGGKLVHASQPGVTPGAYPASQPGSIGFGSSFNVPSITVNSTGHITAVSSQQVTVPSTAASTVAAGLVKIGTTSTSIGSSNSAGTTTPNPYVAVAAADHVHSAATLTLENTGESPATVTYNGAADRTVNFKNLLKAYLPAAGPTAANQVLICSGSNPGGMTTAWASPESFLAPDYGMASISQGSFGTSATAVSMNTGTKVVSGDMNVVTGGFNGIKGGNAYIMCFYFDFSHATATAMLEDVTVTVLVGSTAVSTSTYVLDGSITGAVHNYVNGSVMFVPAGGTELTVQVKLQTGYSTWTVDGNIQLAEVK